MEPLRRMITSKNTTLVIFAVAFLFFYIASNGHNVVLGVVGIALTILNAIVILATK